MATKQHNITVGTDDVLYYIDYNKMDVYVNKNNTSDIKFGDNPNITDDYEFNEDMTQAHFDKFKEQFSEEMQKRYKSLKPVNKVVKGARHLLASDMFIIAIEDNGWSFGVELLNNPKCKNKNLSKHLFPSFAKGMRDILIDLAGEIHVRTGSWSTEVIDKAKAKELDDKAKSTTTTDATTNDTENPTENQENKTAES